MRTVETMLEFPNGKRQVLPLSMIFQDPRGCNRREIELYSDVKSLKHCSIGDTYISERKRHCDWLTRTTRVDLVDEHSTWTHLHKKAYTHHVTNLLQSHDQLTPWSNT